MSEPWSVESGGIWYVRECYIFKLNPFIPHTALCSSHRVIKGELLVFHTVVLYAHPLVPLFHHLHQGIHKFMWLMWTSLLHPAHSMGGVCKPSIYHVFLWYQVLICVPNRACWGVPRKSEWVSEWVSASASASERAREREREEREISIQQGYVGLWVGRTEKIRDWG